MEKMGFWEYTYCRQFHPIIEFVFGIIAIGLGIVLLPVLIPYMLWHKFKSDYSDYLFWYDCKNNRKKD